MSDVEQANIESIMKEGFRYLIKYYNGKEVTHAVWLGGGAWIGRLETNDGTCMNFLARYAAIFIFFKDISLEDIRQWCHDRLDED